MPGVERPIGPSNSDRKPSAFHSCWSATIGSGSDAYAMTPLSSTTTNELTEYCLCFAEYAPTLLDSPDRCIVNSVPSTTNTTFRHAGSAAASVARHSFFSLRTSLFDGQCIGKSRSITRVNASCTRCTNCASVR
jgi:hypothetical protein